MFDFIYNMVKLLVYSIGGLSAGGLWFLWLTIPDDKTFEPFLTAYIKQVNQPPPSTGFVGKLMSTTAANVLPTISNIVIKDYKFFKIASVTLLDETVYFVGIIQNWFLAKDIEKMVNNRSSATVQTVYQAPSPAQQNIITDADRLLGNLTQRRWQ